MIRSCSCLVLAAAFQVIFGQAERSGLQPPPPSRRLKRQSIADYCSAPPPGVDIHKCCPITPLFPDEDLKRCGIEEGKNTPQSSQTKRPCHESKCLMKNANLLLANRSVDYKKLRAFVDKWASINPNFTEAITEAKRVCAYDGGPTVPPVCEQDKLIICLASNALWNCKLQDLDGASGCRILKEHMDDCRPFFYTQSEEEALYNRKLL